MMTPEKAIPAVVTQKLRVKEFGIDRSSCEQSYGEKVQSDIGYAAESLVRNSFEIKIDNIQDAIAFTAFNFADTLAVGAAYGAKAGLTLTPGVNLAMTGILAAQALKILIDTLNDLRNRNYRRVELCECSAPMIANSSKANSREGLNPRDAMDRTSKEIGKGGGVKYDRIDLPRANEPAFDTHSDRPMVA